jgi:hypothetical protein
MLKQNDLAEKHARVELRAYLSAVSAAYVVESDVLRVRLILRNSGVTPAKGAQIIITTFMENETLVVEMLPDIGRDTDIPFEKDWQRCAPNGSVNHWRLTGTISYFDVLARPDDPIWHEPFVFTFDEEGEVDAEGWTAMKPLRAEVGYRPA